MKKYGGMEVWLHTFITSAVDRGEWSDPPPAALSPGIHWIGGWVDHRSGPDSVEKKKSLYIPGKLTVRKPYIDLRFS
jgi:hypothetical protein